MTILSTQKQGALYAISSGLCYGLMGYFGVSLMNAGLSVFNMLFWRFLIASLFVLLLLLPEYKRVFIVNKHNIQVFLYGMIFYGIGTITYFMASQYIGTGLSMVIFFSFPAIVMLLNIIFYKTKITLLYYAACAIIMIGMFFLADPQAVSFDRIGIALGLLSAFCYGAYIFSSKKIQLAPLQSTFMVSTGCMLTCLIVALIDSSFYMPAAFQDWFNIITMGLLCTAVPILLLLQSFKYISSEKAAILSVLEPVFVILFGVLLLDEQLSVLQVVGVIIVLSGALLTLLPNKAE